MKKRKTESQKRRSRELKEMSELRKQASLALESYARLMNDFHYLLNLCRPLILKTIKKAEEQISKKRPYPPIL